MSGHAFLDVISGRDQTALGSLQRAALLGLSLPYAAATAVRNFAYDRRLLRSHRLSVPVISIGNLTAGGTGKSPTVAWLVRWLLAQTCRPAILSRGYRSLPGGENDEKRMLDALCPGVPHVQNADRVAAGQQLLQKTEIDAIVLDDGLQHRRLHRDVDLVLIDALNPWGYGHLLPRGLLREPLSGLHRADVVLITRCDLAEPEQVSAIVTRIRRETGSPVIRTAFAASGLLNAAGERCDLTAMRSQRIVAFCGIGNPSGFRGTLQSCGIMPSSEQFITFPDHRHYTPHDRWWIENCAQREKADVVLTTHKDLVKLQSRLIGERPLWAVEISLSFLDAPEPLLELLKERLNLHEPSGTASSPRRGSPAP